MKIKEVVFFIYLLAFALQSVSLSEAHPKTFSVDTLSGKFTTGLSMEEEVERIKQRRLQALDFIYDIWSHLGDEKSVNEKLKGLRLLLGEERLVVWDNLKERFFDAQISGSTYSSSFGDMANTSVREMLLRIDFEKVLDISSDPVKPMKAAIENVFEHALTELNEVSAIAFLMIDAEDAYAVVMDNGSGVDLKAVMPSLSDNKQTRDMHDMMYASRYGGETYIASKGITYYSNLKKRFPSKIEERRENPEGVLWVLRISREEFFNGWPVLSKPDTIDFSRKLKYFPGEGTDIRGAATPTRGSLSFGGRDLKRLGQEGIMNFNNDVFKYGNHVIRITKPDARNMRNTLVFKVTPHSNVFMNFVDLVDSKEDDFLANLFRRKTGDMKMTEKKRMNQYAALLQNYLNDPYDFEELFQFFDTHKREFVFVRSGDDFEERKMDYLNRLEKNNALSVKELLKELKVDMLKYLYPDLFYKRQEHKNPNILRYIGKKGIGPRVGSHGYTNNDPVYGQQFFVVEYIQGETLLERVQQREVGVLTTEESRLYQDLLGQSIEAGILADIFDLDNIKIGRAGDERGKRAVLVDFEPRVWDVIQDKALLIREMIREYLQESSQVVEVDLTEKELTILKKLVQIDQEQESFGVGAIDYKKGKESTLTQVFLRGNEEVNVINFSSVDFNKDILKFLLHEFSKYCSAKEIESLAIQSA